jgi:hypothetical protein
MQNATLTAGERVRVAAPQGSRYDGRTGTVEQVLPFDSTVLVRLGAGLVLPFANGELDRVETADEKRARLEREWDLLIG